MDSPGNPKMLSHIAASIVILCFVKSSQTSEIIDENLLSTSTYAKRIVNSPLNLIVSDRFKQTRIENLPTTLGFVKGSVEFRIFNELLEQNEWRYSFFSSKLDELAKALKFTSTVNIKILITDVSQRLVDDYADKLRTKIQAYRTSNEVEDTWITPKNYYKMLKDLIKFTAIIPDDFESITEGTDAEFTDLIDPNILLDMDTFDLRNAEKLAQRIITLRDRFDLDVLSVFKHIKKLPSQVSPLSIFNEFLNRLNDEKEIVQERYEKMITYLRFQCLVWSSIHADKMVKGFKIQLRKFLFAQVINDLLEYQPKMQYYVLKPLANNKMSKPDIGKLYEALKLEVRLGRIISDDGIVALSSFLPAPAKRISEYQKAAEAIRKALIDSGLANKVIKSHLYFRLKFEKKEAEKLVFRIGINQHIRSQYLDHLAVLFADDSKAMKAINKLRERSNKLGNEPFQKKSLGARIEKKIQSVMNSIKKRGEKSSDKKSSN